MTTRVDVRGMHVLSDAEVAMVVGGTYSSNDVIEDSGGDSRGVNELVDRNSINPFSSDGRTFVQFNGYMLADYNLDGIFDQAWYADGNGNWRESSDGENWRPSDGPEDDWWRWEQQRNPNL